MGCLILNHILFVVVAVHAKQVCYDHVGCFSNNPPYTNSLGVLPHSPEYIGTTFSLYTRQNQKTAVQLDPNGSTRSVTSTHFNSGHKTVFIIHGFHGSNNDTWHEPMKDALLKADDLNVIVVVWTKGAFDDYNQASANTRVVGAVTANMIKLLHTAAGVDLGLVHIIGHSLGAHVAGYAGKRLYGLGRITGLDPAGPEFNIADVKVRLDSSDANFVDVIHADGILGFQKRMGHVDFYPNGGKHQPGCLIDPIAPLYSCSHIRPIYYFIESISSTCHFTSHPCSSNDDYKKGHCHGCRSGCAEMGYHASPSSHGTYYLKTNWHYPYCSGSH